MAEPVQTTTGAKVAQTVAQGAAVGGGTGIALLPFLNENADAILALCGIGGFLIALAGLLIQWFYTHRRHRWDGSTERRNTQRGDKWNG